MLCSGCLRDVVGLNPRLEAIWEFPKMGDPDIIDSLVDPYYKDPQKKKVPQIPEAPKGEFQRPKGAGDSVVHKHANKGSRGLRPPTPTPLN